jgi:predicted RNase H-like nuclease
MSLILGVDAAWTAHNPSGVALVSTDCDPPKLIRASPSFEDFVLGSGPKAWCSSQDLRASLGDVLSKAADLGGSVVTVIAVDMPIAHGPVRARRRCDTKVSKAFGARGCSTHSPTEQRPGKVSDAFYEEAKAAGFALKTLGSGKDGAALLEVYPHVALLALCRAERRLPYKLSRRRKNFPKLDPTRRLEAVRVEWEKILGRLKREINIDLGIDGKIKTLRSWKAWEDVIDAIVCCWVGLEWLRGRARPYGDEIAAIWVPEGTDLG